MTTATRSVNRETVSSKKSNYIAVLLAILVIASAFAVVYVTDLNRRLFIEYQQKQALHNQLYVEWGKLLLEQSTWSTQARIQSIAQQKLGMVIPESSQVIVIKK